MNWLRKAAIRLWKGSGIEPAKTLPSFIAPVLPRSLVIQLGDGDGDAYRDRKYTCFGCKIKIPLSQIFCSTLCFYYYPGQQFANGEYIPLLVFDCPGCKERHYLAIFPGMVHIGIFGGSPVMDPILIEAVKVPVSYKLYQDRCPDTKNISNEVCVNLDEDYYARLYSKI